MKSIARHRAVKNPPSASAPSRLASMIVHRVDLNVEPVLDLNVIDQGVRQLW
ncbi:MAG: hypothetical protein H0T51_17050 [Pirellulales bacterium]|nr:hypothetical protein [Pirellulales bacterium]